MRLWRWQGRVGRFCPLVLKDSKCGRHVELSQPSKEQLVRDFSGCASLPTGSRLLRAPLPVPAGLEEAEGH